MLNVRIVFLGELPVLTILNIAAFQALVSLLPRLLDPVPVILSDLVMTCVILPLRHLIIAVNTKGPSYGDPKPPTSKAIQHMSQT